MLHVRGALASLVLIIGTIAAMPLFAHAAFCLSATSVDSLKGADLTGMSKMVVGGQQMYCNLDPAAGQPPPADINPNVCTIYCPAPSQQSPTSCSCVNPAPMTGPSVTPPAGGCQPGEHPATAADVPLMTAAGIPNAQVDMCWNPNSQTVGKNDAEAKQYLRSILCTNSQFGGAGPDLTVQKLDSKFAVCAATFLKAASAQLPGTVPLLGGGSNAVCLREGFRTIAQQEKYAQEYRNGGGIACTKGAGCEHPRGIAIDVNTAAEANYQKLWAMGPQYGVNFYLKARDKVHFVPAIAACSAGGVRPDGSSLPGNSPLPPTYYDYPQYYNGGTPVSQSPASALLNGLRGMLGMTQAPPQYMQPQYIPPQQNMTPTSVTSANNPSSYTSGAPTSVPGLSTSNPSGSTGGAPTIGNIFNATSSNINIHTSGNGAIDLINQFASSLAPSSTRAADNSGNANLNQNLQNVVINSPGTQLVQNGIVYVPPTVLPPEIAVNALQTFPTPPIVHPGDLSTYSPQQLSLIQQILSTLKNVLISFLNWLRPFGNRAPTQQMIVD